MILHHNEAHLLRPYVTFHCKQRHKIPREKRERKRNELKWNEHDDSSWSWLYMAVRFGLRESDTHLTDSSIAQSQHPARFKASRDFARSSSKRVIGDGAPHTHYTYVQFVFMYVLACVSLCTYQTTWYGLWQTNFIEMFCSLLTYFQYRENSKVNKRTTRGKCAHSAAAAGCCCSCCGCTRSLATCVQFV